MLGRLTFLIALLWASGFAAAQPAVAPEARSLHDQGVIALEEGRYQAAAEDFQKAVQASPDYWAAHACYLEALRGLGSLAPARAFYADLAKTHPDLAELSVYVAAAQEPDKAIPALDAFLKDHAGDVRALVELGRAHLAAGDARHAEAPLRDAVKADPKSVPAQLLLGDAIFRTEKYITARKQYEAALEIDPNNPAAHVRIALCWEHIGKSDQALQILEKIVSDGNLPRYVPAYWALIWVHLDGKEPVKAAAALDKILTISPESYRAWIVKGQLLLAQDKPLEAVKAFTKATKLQPRTGTGFFCLGWAQEKAADAPGLNQAQSRERLEAAAAAYEACTRLDPSVRPRDSLGFIYLLENKHQDALTQLKRAKDIDPAFAPARVNLGLAEDMADNRTDAMHRYQNVLRKIDRQNSRARVMLALDEWLQGASNSAIRDLQKVLKDHDDDDLAWCFLGDIQYDTRRINEAIRSWKESVSHNPKNFYAWYHMGIAYDDDKRQWQEADDCYRKSLALKVVPPLDLVLRLAEVNDEDGLNHLEEALKFYLQYRQLGGKEPWVPDRITEIQDKLSKKK